jgi:hypothetical protein
VSAKPHVFPRFAARTPVLVVSAHPARLAALAWRQVRVAQRLLFLPFEDTASAQTTARN